MKNLIFPSKLHYGIDALNSVFDIDYGSVLILSDNLTFIRSAAVSKIKQKFDSMMTKTNLIVCDSEEDLFDRAYSYADSEIPDAVIAAGDGKTLDCAAAVAKLTGIKLICLVGTVPGALCEYDTLDVFLYKTMPDVCILDPCFITYASSDKIAYEAAAMMNLAAESYMKASDVYIRKTACEAFCEIYRNILPSYTGEISAREKLLEGMYAAYTAYINSYDYAWESPSYRLGQFFSKWGIPKLSSIALASSYFAESFFDGDYERFCSLAHSARASRQKELAAIALKDSVMRIKAKLSIPSVIKSFGVNEQDFIASCADVPDEDKDLYYRCYYGSFMIVKNNEISGAKQK